MKKPYETFDIDLLQGKTAEDSFSRVLCTARFEHKLDKLAYQTGNIAIEYQTKKDFGVIPSGISITTADWWVTEFRPGCRLVVPTDYVKKLARRAIEAGNAKWIGDGNNHHNALVPFGWFLKGVE